MDDLSTPNDLAGAIRASADRLGVSPNDMATIMSYESGLRHDRWGGKDGNYYGLLQFGPEERAKYGVKPGETSAVDQVGAAENFLRDRGVKPGMGILDLYSTVNAGRPGLYNRSDAANGGAPGTVADKVATMAAHRVRANALLGGESPAAGAGGAPFSLAPGSVPAEPDAQAGLLAAMAAIPKLAEESNAVKAPDNLIDFQLTPAHARARAMAKAAARSAIA